MKKRVIFEFSEGDFTKGFPVTVRIVTDGIEGSTRIADGFLPPSPSSLTELTLETWRKSYEDWIKYCANREIKVQPQTNEVSINFSDLTQNLENDVNNWLNSEDEKWKKKVIEKLQIELNKKDEIRIIIQTDNHHLRRLPWQVWDLFIDKFYLSEFAFSPSEQKTVAINSNPQKSSQVKILVVLGEPIEKRQDKKIDYQSDIDAIKKLGSDIEFLPQPTCQQLIDKLWDKPWQILFYSGHSISEADGSKGYLQLRENEKIKIDDLKESLKECVGKGLQLAIFNSCQGLGIAKQLEDLALPQIIVMREKVPDIVAQTFLRDFLKAFAGGDGDRSLHDCVREARKKLQDKYQKNYPGISWLPVICQQQTDTVIFTWNKLIKNSKIWQRKLNKMSIFIAGISAVSLVIGGYFLQVFLNKDDVALSISVSNDIRDDAVSSYFRPDEETKLTYQTNKIEEDVLSITPQMKYLAKLANGDPISEIKVTTGEPPFFSWQFPNLDIRLVNNSNKTIYITDIILEVEKSLVDPSPVVIIPENRQNLLRFELINEGWGEIKDASLQFNLAPLGEKISWNGNYQHKINIGNFTDSYTVDISNTFQQLGLDFQSIGYKVGVYNRTGNKSYYEESPLADDCKWKYLFFQKDDKLKEKCQNIIESLGIFKDSKSEDLVYGIAYGEILFSGKTLEGKENRQTIKFSTKVPILDAGQYGAPGTPTYQYDAKLDVDRENYQVIVQSKGSSVSQYIKPNEIDRFNILIATPKSSFHKFRVRFIYNNGKSIVSKPIDLRTFVPKSGIKQIKTPAQILVEEGENLAKKGNIEEATIKFNEALRLEPNSDINPKLKAQKIAVESLSSNYKTILTEGNLKKVFDGYEEVKKFEQKFKIPITTYSNICTLDNLWFYSTNDIIFVCNKLVTFVPNDPLILFTRGLANAINKNIEQTIKDFEQSIELLNKIIPKNDKEKQQLDDNINVMKNLIKKLQQGYNTPLANSLMIQGAKQAKEGNIKIALQMYKDIEKADPEVEIIAVGWHGICKYGNEYNKANEAIETCEKAVSLEPNNPKVVEDRGVAKALTGNINGAIQDFQSVIAMIDKIDKPNENARRAKLRLQNWISLLKLDKNPVKTMILIDQGKRLIEQGKIQEAITAYTEAQKFVPTDISAKSWNILCWKGSLNGFANQVINACEKAVEIEPENARFKDIRGIAKALTGDTGGAIKDFEAFIKWIDKELENNPLYDDEKVFKKLKDQRYYWIDSLRKGNNPFTVREVENLRSENKRDKH
ncbi:MAG TPA: CHAT domain-containing protein [Nostocaceae cyanobacterium]|nr:CHAT domain-containing protein [Nostocaceae cyanobacterium]